MEDGTSAFKIVTGKSTGMRPLWKSRCRWDDNIRIGYKEIGNSTRNWVDSAEDRNY